MVTIRKRNLKVFTFAFVLVTVTSFLLNYKHQVTMITWDPKHIITQFSEHIRRLINFPRRPCSCSTCISELGHSLWFDQRFNSTMQPFLTSQNALIPEDSYRWWLKLQGEKSPKNINDTLKELFDIIPGDRDPLQERGTFSCRRCAVVGNSGNLRQSQYGQEIDSHDFVLSTYVPVPRKIKVKKEKILIYNPSFIKYVYENWLQNHGRYPSTGLLSVIFALHVCDEVNVYGFGANSKGHWHHYWENNASAGAFRKTGVHDGDFESNVTLTLASIEKIKFFKGR
ncbi:CMP-N-acetylneuraminate-beta-galactosamide-alpha-2,3-sialyltransferase 1 isoform X2 [Coturnix japonica]|uniref:CMP-N-acetylneuraminate-beta-galactosamide- alpha-2,3-sialyltransferase 1 isoform X2 n=1 Tax=Coturnix japonica TaxID=93934 RepID=UPI000777263E|nr:CMP-N-acetylneuraminate-beta-galactosamide-alpha-2,3-sialyltransferase 1 isoform X2 [Coturnix japonica]